MTKHCVIYTVCQKKCHYFVSLWL